MALLALTVKVYEAPYASPVIRPLVAAAPLTANPVQEEQAGEGVIEYWVIADPLFAGSVQVTVTLPSVAAVAVPMVGASGGMAAVIGEEATPVPAPYVLVAFTVNVYAVPSVSPPMEVLVVDPPVLNPVQVEHAGFDVTV
jgi:hypothetical protein